MAESIPVDDYYLRCARFVEGVRETYGHGYGEGDIEHMFKMFVARNLIFLEQNNDNLALRAALSEHAEINTAGSATNSSGTSLSEEVER